MLFGMTARVCLKFSLEYDLYFQKIVPLFTPLVGLIKELQFGIPKMLDSVPASFHLEQ